MSHNKYKAGKLGDSFWGNFYLIDEASERHSVAALREAVKNLGIQTTLERAGTEITLDVLRANMLQVKSYLRAKGFKVPRPSDNAVVCVWDLQKRACNSTFLQTYLVLCEVCPQSIIKG